MKYILEIVVFLCGASLMILELVGSRVLAPYIGTSTIVWTSLIGIILAFLSLGYFLGGKMADKKTSFKNLSLVILASAFFVFLIILINEPILTLIRGNIKNVYLGAVMATIVLFSAPSFLLGIVSPYAFRLKVTKIEESGRTAGRLYAISTIGSIVGTFSAGFFLIPFLGTVKILYFITGVLIFSFALALSKELNKKETVSIFLIFILVFPLFYYTNAFAKDSNMIDVDTEYNRIKVFTGKIGGKGRVVKVMTTDPFSVQSGMFLDKDDDLIFDYLKYYRLVDHFNPNLKESLLIGGAAYAYPKDYLRNHDEATIDVVEIDAKMTQLARNHFNLKEDPRLKIYHQDGRVFLNNNQKKYDAIFLDAFTSRLSIPYQLTTLEAVEEMHRGLKDDGVVLLNIISSFSGEKSKFLKAEYKTFKEIFPQVYLFNLDNGKEDEIQNIMLIALKSNEVPSFESENEEFDQYLKSLWTEEIEEDLPILVDDYAPVDYYMMNTI